MGNTKEQLGAAPLAPLENAHSTMRKKVKKIFRHSVSGLSVYAAVLGGDIITHQVKSNIASNSANALESKNQNPTVTFLNGSHTKLLKKYPQLKSNTHFNSGLTSLSEGVYYKTGSNPSVPGGMVYLYQTSGYTFYTLIEPKELKENLNQLNAVARGKVKNTLSQAYAYASEK